MGKLVIKFQGKLVGEVSLKLGETKIGRKPGCDVVLDETIVSGEHAVIRTVGMKATIQDLGSKNGTFIENQRVTQHELRHGETIVIGSHSLMYRDDPNLDARALDKRQAPPAAAGEAHNVTTELVSFAQLLAVDGKDKGKRVPIVKETITIDNPGKSPARISRTPDGYLLEPAAVGPGEPKINDKPIPPGGHFLDDGDIIEVAGTRFRFSE